MKSKELLGGWLLIVFAFIITPFFFNGCTSTSNIAPAISNIYHQSPQWVLRDSSPKTNPDYNLKSYDINADGINDFTITHISPGVYGYSGAYILCGDNCFIRGREQFGETDSAHYYIPELPYGQLISLQDTFYNNNIVGSKYLFGRTAYDQILHTYFVGFKLLVRNENHYAWVKFSDQSFLPSCPVTCYGIGMVKILESGYNNLPNTEIKAGEY